MEKRKKNMTFIVLGAIASLTIMECVAMTTGHNGTMRAAIIAVIAGLAGYVLPAPKKFLG